MSVQSKSFVGVRDLAEEYVHVLKDPSTSLVGYSRTLGPGLLVWVISLRRSERLFEHAYTQKY